MTWPNGGPGRDESGHRWSGWPGAWCLYCGVEDPREVALADGKEAIVEPCKASGERKRAVDEEMNPGSHGAVKR